MLVSHLARRAHGGAPEFGAAPDFQPLLLLPVGLSSCCGKLFRNQHFALVGIGLARAAAGGTSWLKALVALPLIAMNARSLAKGEAVFDYLTEEQTSLFTAMAFEEAGADLLRILQLPPTRAWGSYPVASVEEYQHRLPNDPAMQKIILVEDRHFPHEFEKAVAPRRKPLRSDCAVAAILLVIALVCAGAVASCQPSWIRYAHSGVIQ